MTVFVLCMYGVAEFTRLNITNNAVYYHIPTIFYDIPQTFKIKQLNKYSTCHGNSRGCINPTYFSFFFFFVLFQCMFPSLAQPTSLVISFMSGLVPCWHACWHGFLIVGGEHLGRSRALPRLLATEADWAAPSTSDECASSRHSFSICIL